MLCYLQATVISIFFQGLYIQTLVSRERKGGAERIGRGNGMGGGGREKRGKGWKPGPAPRFCKWRTKSASVARRNVFDPTLFGSERGQIIFDPHFLIV